MTRDPPGRLPPPLKRFGAELREHAEAEERAGPQTERGHSGNRQRWRIASLSAGVVAAATITAVFVVLDTGRNAHADSAVNRAPSAAAASQSVSFNSTITITVGNRQLERYTEEGEIDFAHRDYLATLNLGKAGGAIYQRRVGDTLYITQAPHGATHPPLRWLAVAIAREPAARFASRAENEQFTDPPVMLDALARTRSPVRCLGPGEVNSVQTNVYRLQTNLAAFLREAGGGRSQPPSYRQVAATLTVWLDHEGRPSQVKESFAARGGAKMTTVVGFTDYGVKVNITRPPDSALAARRPISAPSPLVASPSRLFERLLFIRATGHVPPLG
jgi:hypothetical protein